MKYVLPLGFGFVTVIHGCSEVVPGSCYPDPAGGAGGAGSMAVGVGVGASSGDFISPPQNGPLDYGGGANPCIIPQSPCDQNCEAESETRALECGKIADGAQRAKCQENNYWIYKSCRGNCQQQSDEKCRQACDKIYDACMAKCKDGPCRDACFKDYSACLKKCER